MHECRYICLYVCMYVCIYVCIYLHPEVKYRIHMPQRFPHGAVNRTKWGKNSHGKWSFWPAKSSETHTMVVLVISLPVGNGCEALNKSEELLLRGYDGRHADSGAAGSCRLKKQVNVGKNFNFELGEMPWGDLTGGVLQTKTTFVVQESHATRGCSMRRSENSRRNEVKPSKCFSFCRESNESESHWSRFMLIEVGWRQGFHSERSNQVLRDVFLVNMKNCEAQNELCRATKVPEQAYRISLSYERVDNYAKTYVTKGGTASSSRGGGWIQI